MITFITGVPGSGKTLYCIDKLLRPLIGATVKTTVNGVDVEIPRTVYTNINGLLLEHELIDGNGSWSSVAKTWVFEGVPGGLKDWHVWAKPGSIIIFDEVQKSWKPRPAGSPVSPDIEALETHRHMGVDFILLTQHSLLVDRNLLAFVARHLHVRRVGNMNLAIVYEWDHCSKSLLFKNSITKSTYRYNKSVFDLYKSAELHTKQPRRLPSLLWFILAGVCGVAYAAPTLISRIESKVHPEKAVVTASVKTSSYVVSGNPDAEPLTKSDKALAVPSEPSKPIYSGCITSASRCRCFDKAGFSVQLDVAACRDAVNVLGLSVPIFDAAASSSPLPRPLVNAAVTVPAASQ